jgi:hypothetical protein
VTASGQLNQFACLDAASSPARLRSPPGSHLIAAALG